MQLSEYKYSYKSGKNPWTEYAHYSCSYCDMELWGYEVGYVGAGRMCANGEHSPCIRCGEENSVFRGEDED